MRERSAEKSLTNAIATTGVVSMAAATSAAGRSLSFVIQVSPSDTKSQDVWLLAKWGSDRPFKEHYLTSFQRHVR